MFYMDILADPKGQEVFGPMISKAFAALGTEKEPASEAAGEAISDEMSMAMLNYMPIRGALSFGGGIPEEQMAELLRRINE